MAQMKTDWAVTDDGHVFPSCNNPMYAYNFCRTFDTKTEAEVYAKKIRQEEKEAWMSLIRSFHSTKEELP